MRTYTPRKMRQNEFRDDYDHVKRDAAGALCHFAVEALNGATVVGVSWQQACALAERMNELEVAA